MKKRPAIYLFFSVFSGIIFALCYQLSLLFYFIAGSVFLFALLFNNHQLRVFCLLLIAFFLAGAQTRYEIGRYEQKAASLSADETLYEGIIKEVQQKSDGSKKLYVSLSTFNITLSLKDAASGLKVKPGMPFRIKARVLPFKKPLSPVHFDAYTYGLAHNLHGHAIISDPRHVSLGPKQSENKLLALRQKLSEVFFSVLTPHQASLLLALILGDTSLFDEEQKASYQNIGAQHLLAVSGLQVALIAYLCFLILLPFCGFLMPAKRAHYAHFIAGLCTLFLVWFFVALCHWPKSAIRAALMASVVIIPTMIGRKHDILDAFFISALLALIYDPLSILDIGFLLSYAAVFGLISAHLLSASLIHQLEKRSWLLKNTFNCFITAISAFIATLPIIAYFFGSIAPMGALANFLLVPAAALFQIPAIIFGLLGALFKSTLLIKLAAFFASIIEIMVQVLSELLGHVLYLPTLPILFWLLVALGLFLIIIGLFRFNRLLLLFALLITIIPISLLILNKDDGLLVRILAVGQGDATLFSMPSGHHMLIDAGGQPFGNYDPGKAIIIPTLRRLGIKKLDVLVISHPDPDHILGAFSLIDIIPIKEIWHSGYKKEHPLTKRLEDKARINNIPIKNAQEIKGTHLFGSTKITVLAPNPTGEKAYFEELSANNNSLVLRIVHDGHALLWPGDLESIGENLLLKDAKNIEATILKAPHHGSKTSSTPDFIAAVNPRHIIYSTGYKNRFNFPHEEVVNRYKTRNIQSSNTAIDGEITIRIQDQHISLNSWTKKYTLFLGNDKF